jgi:hypothetical protein
VKYQILDGRLIIISHRCSGWAPHGVVRNTDLRNTAALGEGTLPDDMVVEKPAHRICDGSMQFLRVDQESAT